MVVKRAQPLDTDHVTGVFPQSQAMVVDGCGQQLQHLSLLDEDRRRFLLLEEERQRVATLRRMQIESEQFRYFEDQLRRQELANRRGEEAEQKVTRCDIRLYCDTSTAITVTTTTTVTTTVTTIVITTFITTTTVNTTVTVTSTVTTIVNTTTVTTTITTTTVTTITTVTTSTFTTVTTATTIPTISIDTNTTETNTFICIELLLQVLLLHYS